MTGGATAIPEVQALLRALAVGRDVAELGAAYGETAAVLAETARSVVTVECDPERVAIARERLAGLANVELLEGDAFEQLDGRGPFGLVFADGGVRAQPHAWEAILALTEPGGLIVKDDMTPQAPQAPVYRSGVGGFADDASNLCRPVEGDDIREFLLRDPRLAAVEILATPEMAVIVAARLV